MITNRTLRHTIVALSILCYFFCFAGRGLQADLSHDDLMNLYKCWYPPVSQHVAEVIAFFTYSESFRPMGSLFYRLIFELFGMEALPYRIACFGLLLLNIWLAYRVARRLSNSRETGVIAALLFCYHRGFWALYVNTGMCFDLLCFSFYMSAFLYYLRHRHASWRHTAASAALYVCCITSKELGVTLPAAIFVYELLRRPSARWWTWLRRDARIPLTGIAINLLFLFGRVYGSGGLSAVDGYQPSYRASLYFARGHHFLSEALYNPRWLTPIAALLVFSLLVLMAVWSRWLPLRFAVAWMPISILPVAFIPERGLDSATIAALALAMTAALILTEVTRCFFACGERQSVQFAALLLVLTAVNGKDGQIDFDGHFQEGRLIRAVYNQIRELQPAVPRDTNILFLHDPFPQMTWATSFIVALHTRDQSVRVYRLDRLPKDATPEFGLVLSYERKHLTTCSIDWAPGGGKVASVCTYPPEPNDGRFISSLTEGRN